jgi:hypothetical protein
MKVEATELFVFLSIRTAAPRRRPFFNARSHEGRLDRAPGALSATAASQFMGGNAPARYPVIY